MVKRGKKVKKISKKKEVSDEKVEKILVENFVILQKVLTNLSGKFDKLTNQISDLLEIFEKSAETLAKRDFRVEQKSEETDKIIEGIKNLSDQNKILAKGITLLHEPPERNYTPSITNFEAPKSPAPVPVTNSRKIVELDEHQKDISAKLRKLRPL